MAILGSVAHPAPRRKQRIASRGDAISPPRSPEARVAAVAASSPIGGGPESGARRRRAFLQLLALLAILMGADAASGSGQNRVGTAAAPELLIPVGARDMAMSGAAIATTSGIEALHWNPAGLASGAAGASMMFSTMSYIADIRLNYAGVSQRFGRWGFLAAHVKALDFGEIPITTESAPDGTGGRFSPTFFTVGGSYAKGLTDRINVGFTARYIVNRIDRVEGTAVSFSAGLQYADLGMVDGLDLGVTVKHIGTRMQFEGPGLLRPGQLRGLRRPDAIYQVPSSSADLPSVFELGLAYRASDVRFSSVFQHHNFAFDQWKLGAEYEIGELFALRSGFDLAAGAGEHEFIFGTSFGAGLKFQVSAIKLVRIDYAYTTTDYFDGLDTFSVQFDF
jgi:hypothetical protein